MDLWVYGLSIYLIIGIGLSCWGVVNIILVMMSTSLMGFRTTVMKMEG